MTHKKLWTSKSGEMNNNCIKSIKWSNFIPVSLNFLSRVFKKNGFTFYVHCVPRLRRSSEPELTWFFHEPFWRSVTSERLGTSGECSSAFSVWILDSHLKAASLNFLWVWKVTIDWCRMSVQHPHLLRCNTCALFHDRKSLQPLKDTLLLFDRNERTTRRSRCRPPCMLFPLPSGLSGLVVAIISLILPHLWLGSFGLNK